MVSHFPTRSVIGIRFVLTVCLTLLLFERWTVYNTPLSGLDGSWALAIHLARQLNLVHGTEFVFTYGPLSWLVTRLPIAAPAWPLILSDAVYLLSAATVLWLALGDTLTLSRTLLVTCLVALHRQTAGMETPFMFYYFVLAGLFFHQRTGRIWFLVWAVGLAVFTFYLKANVGLVSLGSVIIYGLWQAIYSPKNRTVSLLSILSLLLLLPITAQFLPVKLYPFIVANWHLITSFNDVMAVLADWHALLAGVLILGLSGVLFGYVVNKLWRTEGLRQFWQQDGCLLFLAAIQLFVLFKQSFLRADVGHTGLFFKHGVLPFSLLVLYSGTPLLRRIAMVPIVLIVVAAPFLVPYHWDAGVLYHWIPQSIAYGRDILHPLTPQMTPMENPWPAQWLTRLKDKRVDIIPDDVALLYNCHLQYAPRPVIQTYQVTDGYLDSLNAAYFLSKRAPDYVLLTVSSVDNRDPFGDETLTKLSLLRAYQLADTTSSWLLLQRRPVPLRLTLIRKETTIEQLDKVIAVADTPNMIQLWQVEGQYSLLGSVAKLLFQPPRLGVQFTRRNREQKTFRTALPLLKTGILLPAHPHQLAELNHYLQTGGNLPDSSKIHQVNLLTQVTLPGGFAPTLTLTRRFYRLSPAEQ